MRKHPGLFLTIIILAAAAALVKQNMVDGVVVAAALLTGFALQRRWWEAASRASAFAAGVVGSVLAALIGADGKLAAIGSLLVQEKIDAGTLQGNMLVPIELLEPILDAMLKTGKANRPVRPWLGFYTAEAGSRIAVAGLAPRGPAERAGVLVGDIIAEVGGAAPSGLADLWRRVWSAGPVGAVVRLKVLRNGKSMEFSLSSADRSDFLKKPHLH